MNVKPQDLLHQSGVEFDATEHTWDGGKITQESTAIKEGVKTYNCVKCDKFKTEMLPKKTPTTEQSKIEQPKPEQLKLQKQLITTAKINSYKAKNLKRKKAIFSLKATTSGKGRLTYKVTKHPKNCKKYISVSKSGKVTLKKGCKKGKYKITITAPKTAYYEVATKTVTIKVSISEVDEYIFAAADFGDLNYKDKRTKKTINRVMVYANGKYIVGETTPCYQ